MTYRNYSTKLVPAAESERLRVLLERARPCVRESLNSWDRLLLEQEKAPRSNAPHMLPEHYITILRKQVQELDELLKEIDGVFT